MLRITGLGCDHAIQVGMRISVCLRACVCTSFCLQRYSVCELKKEKIYPKKDLK